MSHPISWSLLTSGLLGGSPRRCLKASDDAADFRRLMVLGKHPPSRFSVPSDLSGTFFSPYMFRAGFSFHSLLTGKERYRLGFLSTDVPVSGKENKIGQKKSDRSKPAITQSVSLSDSAVRQASSQVCEILAKKRFPRSLIFCETPNTGNMMRLRRRIRA